MKLVTNKVAPLAGAWIEMPCRHPCGSAYPCVAPLAGAWIEMPTALKANHSPDVAPLAGAWIEMHETIMISVFVMASHPSRVRGLKYHPLPRYGRNTLVAPLAGAWIEMHPACRVRRAWRRRTPRGCVD